MTRLKTFWALTPTFNPVGGVIKIFDYLRHARALGWSVSICAPESISPHGPLLAVPGVRGLLDDPAVSLREGLRPAPRMDDLVFFSWPAHYVMLEPYLPRDFSRERVVHLVQNTRHANPDWIGGVGLRLLGRPMTRIVTSDAVGEMIAPYVNTRFATRVIELGHRTDYFARQRVGGLPRQVKVAYTTWKSDLGDRVRARLRPDGQRWSFRAIRGPATWSQLRRLYHWCDVFLGTPGPQEGHYLPGLEAMAAGALVVIPDVEGNRAYCRFGENCMQVTYEDVDAYVEALRGLAAAPVQRVEALRAAGYAEGGRHTLEAERAEFERLLGDLK